MTPAKVESAFGDEICAEHSLIANRLSWYVTSQSFLVTATWYPSLVMRIFLNSVKGLLRLIGKERKGSVNKS
jgi:hypothetical protein